MKIKEKPSLGWVFCLFGPSSSSGYFPNVAGVELRFLLFHTGGTLLEDVIEAQDDGGGLGR